MHTPHTPADCGAQDDSDDDVADTDTFDWSDSENVIARSQLAVAVYPNRYGDAVIRSERDEFHQEDTTIIVPRHRIAALIERLQELRDAAELDVAAQREAAPSVAPSAPKDPTNAERQRRYRERKRNGGDTVTPRDASVTLSTNAAQHV